MAVVWVNGRDMVGEKGSGLGTGMGSIVDGYLVKPTLVCFFQSGVLMGNKSSCRVVVGYDAGSNNPLWASCVWSSYCSPLLGGWHALHELTHLPPV